MKVYLGVVGRISTYLSGDHHSMTPTYAILVLNWMNGYSLSWIIDRHWDYWKKRKKKNIATVIRDTMRLIEEYARFKFVKYSSCYIDVLTYYFETIKRDDLIEKIPRIRLWLEFGASQGTQISLIGLGFSRTTAIILSELISKEDLKPIECLKWLNSIDINSLDISSIVVAEVEKIMTKHHQEL